MDLYGTLHLRWSFGYNGSQLNFIDNDTLLYGCGNTLTFVNRSGKHTRSLSSEGRGVGPIATCPQTSLVAYAEVTLQPQIFILKYPVCSLETTLKGNAQLEYSCLAFSANGKRIASLSGVPDFTLTIWNWERGVAVCSTVVGPGYQDLSFSPLNWKQLCLVGPGKATLFTLEQCNTLSLLSSLELEVPECSSLVGKRIHPKQPPIAVASKISRSMSHMGRKLERSETKSDQLLSAPPNMSAVLYKESYDEFVRERRPVVLTSHCWTTKQSIYLGCLGGQLLQVDFESGEVVVLANPQLVQIKDQSFQSLSSQSSSTAEAKEGAVSRQSMGEETSIQPKPQTAHAVLSEGSISCLALSRRGLFTAGKNGIICCFDLGGDLRLIESRDLQQPVASLCWSIHHDRLAVSTKQGAIHLMDPLNLSSVSLVSDHHCSSEFVGINILAPGFSNCVTCRADGTVQVWSAEDAALVSSFSLETECSSLACPLSCPMAAVGTASGHLCVLNLTDIAVPRPAARRHMFHSPITAIRYDQNAQFMGTISSSGPAFLFDARPSSKFTVLGYLDVQGTILDLSILSLVQGEKASTRVAVLAESEGKRLVTLIKIPNSIVDEAPAELYADATKRFSPDFVLKQEILLTDPVVRLTLAPNHSAFALLQSRLQLAKFAFPPADEKGIVDLEISPELCYPAHELSGGEVVLSFHQKWLASVAPDGNLLFRLVENPEKTVCSVPHHYSRGGCTGVVMTTDSQQVFTTGDQGTLTCWKWEFSSHGSTKSSTAVEYSQRRMKALEGTHRGENAALEAMVTAGGWKVESGEIGSEGDGSQGKTWLETVEEEAHKAEDEKYAEIKTQLRQEIRELREKVLSMMTANEGLPDIERLERHDFVLDTEEYQRLQAQQDSLIEQVREEIKLSHLAKMFLREKIKKQCWSDMTVKGKTVKAFQSRLEVSNYTMKARSEEKLQELERIKVLRRVEIAEEKVRKVASASLVQTFQATAVEDLDEDDLLEGAEQTQKGEEGPGDPDSLLGSHGAQYGGGCELLYDQFQLQSLVAKKHQTVLLENCIYCMKETFNKEFDEVFRLKKAEIARIQEKNLRIRKILGQLKLDDPIVQPSMDADEEPERLLKVEDDEVTVEQYISPEMKKKMEEDEKLEEQKKLAGTSDKPRERALDMMMGGRLEANVEEDLFKDMPRPEFMLKNPVEMTEDEIRMAREFEKKETAFLEEREKLKKALEAELRKLQSSITQSMEQFEERLYKLFHLKIKTEMSVQQEELKIIRLMRALLVEGDVTMRENQLNRLLDEKKVAKVAVGGTITTAKHHVEEGRRQYEQVALEDKELDRHFRKEFIDCDPFVDQLYKLFRRRPRGQRVKQGPSEGTLVPDPKSQNPFAQRPSSAAGGGQGQHLEDPMSELDDPANMPEGLDPSQWERFVIARRRKVESEQKVKRLALELAEMEAFQHKREAEEDLIQQDIQDAFRELNKLQEDKTQYDLNLEIQLLLKQGQVEVDMGEFVPDFSTSVLVHRSVIEELNSQIKGLGEGKLASMEECKDFKRGIHMLEWELKKLRMEAEDLVQKARDVQMLRVTKELQQRLMEEGLANKDQHEIETLEKTIELNQKMHCNRVQGHKRSLERLQQQVDKKKKENRELNQQLVEMQVSVVERQGVENLAGIPPSEANAKQRMQSIVKRRQLVELVRAQAGEISVLTTEVERLRMRTFPALVQVD